MYTNLNDVVDVICSGSKLNPIGIIWKRQKYKITKLGYHHTFTNGNALCHVFSVVSNKIFFKLVFNSKTLMWNLESTYEEL